MVFYVEACFSGSMFTELPSNVNGKLTFFIYFLSVGVWVLLAEKRSDGSDSNENKRCLNKMQTAAKIL